MSTRHKTPSQVKKEFEDAGVSISAWAKTHNFKRETVVALLRGRTKGLYGDAHRVAVALGLKSGRVVNVARFKPAPEVE